MAYNPDPSSLSFPVEGTSFDWLTAENGKWFIGVVDTNKGAVFLVPVNPFERDGELNQDALNNDKKDARSMNRYASGLPADRTGAPQPFIAFMGGNWLERRPVGQTHHTAVALHYGSDPDDCLGFALVKKGIDIGQMKCTSTSLNGTKLGTWTAHSFARQTAANQPGFHPGSYQMPTKWRDAVAEFLRTGPLNVSGLAVSHD